MTIFKIAQELEEKGTPFVVVTMIGHRGHAPQDTGAKAIVTSEGLNFGTIGGGKVEAKAIVLAQESIAASQMGEPSASKNLQQSFSVKWNLKNDVGMTCGGEVEFLFEIFSKPRWQIVVFGAGHIAQALVPLLAKLNCQITCIDSRKEWLEKFPANFKNIFKVEEANMPATITKLPRDAFYVLMTQGHATDLPILKTILSEYLPPYIGVIGSHVKAIKIKNELKEFGIPMDRIDALFSPMGYPIGTNDPEEIAISIAAQLLEQRAKVFGEDKWA